MHFEAKRVVSAALLLGGVLGVASANAQGITTVDGADIPTCTGPKHAGGEPIHLNLPKAGAESEAEVGRAMSMSVDAGTDTTGVLLKREASFEARDGGTKYRVVLDPGPFTQGAHGLSPAGYKVFANSDPKPLDAGRGLTVGIAIGRGPLKLVGVLYKGGLITGGLTTIDGAEFVPERCLFPGDEQFRKELIYTGVSKGEINLQYREFSHDMARPAITQDLHYDLAAGNEIGFRGARLKILKATNASVKYVVLKPLE